MSDFLTELRAWDQTDYRQFPRLEPPCGGGGIQDIDQRLAATFAVLCSGKCNTDDLKMDHLMSLKNRWSRNVVRWAVECKLDEEGLFAVNRLISTLDEWFCAIHADVPDRGEMAA